MTYQAAYRPMLARQPILDRNLELEAYELLYRAPAGTSRPSGPVMTATVLLDWFTSVTDSDPNIPVWVSFPAAMLVDAETIRTFPADQLVVEILDSLIVNDRIHQVIGSLGQDGYQLVLDDWTPGDARAGLLEAVDAVKLDLIGLGPVAIANEVAHLKSVGVKVVGNSVETWEQHQWCLDAGCDSLQGYFFAKPVVEENATLPGPLLGSIQILGEMNKDEWNIRRLVELIRAEPALATRLLRLANSTYLGAARRVDSIEEAVMRVGATTLRRWMVICAMADANQGPAELTRLAVTRARLTELLIGPADRQLSESAFTAGMLSAVPAMVGTTIDQVLSQVRVSDELTAAVARHEGVVGAKLEAAMNIEHFGGTPITESEADLPELYLTAIAWADGLIGQL